MKTNGFIEENAKKILSSSLKDSLKEVALLNKDKKQVVKYTFKSLFFNKNGYLVGVYEIPKSNNIQEPIKYIQTLDEDGNVLTENELNTEVVFGEGIGGIQTIEFNISGSAGEIVYKENDYLTKDEWDELYGAEYAKISDVNEVLATKANISEVEDKISDVKNEVNTLLNETTKLHNVTKTPTIKANIFVKDSFEVGENEVVLVYNMKVDNKATIDATKGYIVDLSKSYKET